MLNGINTVNDVIGYMGRQKEIYEKVAHSIKTPIASEKFKSLDSLMDHIKINRDKRIVVASGTFLLPHFGHGDYFRKARSLGDELVVLMNTDDSIKRIGRCPDFVPQYGRVVDLSLYESVDHIVLFDENDPSTMLHHIKPDVFTKGQDWKGREDEMPETSIVYNNGGRIYFLDFSFDFSSTDLCANVLQTLQGGQKIQSYDYFTSEEIKLFGEKFIQADNLESFRDTYLEKGKRIVLVSDILAIPNFADADFVSQAKQSDDEVVVLHICASSDHISRYVPLYGRVIDAVHRVGVDHVVASTDLRYSVIDKLRPDVLFLEYGEEASMPAKIEVRRSEQRYDFSVGKLLVNIAQYDKNSTAKHALVDKD